jgi:thiaminase
MVNNYINLLDNDVYRYLSENSINMTEEQADALQRVFEKSLRYEPEFPVDL